MASQHGRHGERFDGIVGIVLSLVEAVERTGVHYQTVRRASGRGDLKAAKIGGGVIIAVEDLDAWQPKDKHVPRRYRRDALAAATLSDGTRPCGAYPER